MTPIAGAAWQRLGIVLTEACNLRCGYCNVPPGRHQHLSWHALRASLEALLPSADESIEVTFTGGEPLLAFATLQRAVSYVEQRMTGRRVRWRLLTNGLLLDDEKLSFLEEHRFSVNLSFDGVPAAQALRGATTFGLLAALLDHIRDTYPELFTDRLKVAATVSPPTVPCLGESVDYFVEKGVRSFEIGPATEAIGWELPAIEELERQFVRVSARLLNHFERTGEVPLMAFRKSAQPDPVLSDWSCLVVEGQSPTIDVDGTTCACLRATATYQSAPVPAMRPAVEALRLGFAFAPGFAERLAGMPEAVRATGAFEHPERRYSSYRSCGDCEFLGRCRVCPLASASVPGWDDKYRVSDFLCAFNQVALAHRDRFPCQPTANDFFTGKVPLSALTFRNTSAAT